MLNLYQSNMLDALMRLYLAVREPARDPLVPETLLVPSLGMQRWLQLVLAREQGIAANLGFQLPASFVWRLITRVFPEVPKRSAFDPEVLAWRVLATLPGLRELEGAALAANWQAADAAGRYELAWRVADVFDQYLIYRPDWLAAWEKGRRLGLGGDEPWQAALWQRLTAGGLSHRAGLLLALEEKLRSGAVPGLPASLSVFGVSTLPPRFWDLLQALGTQCEVNLFLLNPSDEYWGQLRRGDAAAGGHPLLASLGQQGRDFINTVAASGVHEPLGSMAFVSPADAGSASGVSAAKDVSLLATLQTDLLRQRVRTPDERITVRADDVSFQVHVCHSALREVEVLHDQLLMLFRQRPEMNPDDVLVMCTDIQRYAPLIDAVFATRQLPAAIPFTIADRRLETEEPLLRRFADLLALPGSRFEVERVLALLEEPALRARFDLAENDVPLIRRWCEELHLRWGRDAADRRERGLPDDVPLTWRDALARLQLGFALPLATAPADDARFAGRVPLEAALSAGQAQVVARLSLLLEALLRWENRLARPRALIDWADAFDALLTDFFAETADSREALQQVRAGMAELREQARRAPEAGPQPYAVMRRWLSRQLKGLESRRGFLHGAVTFCAMVPMRSLPFRMIAVLGMDDGAFPRQQKPWPFDLMWEHPRAGDRSRRQDDRYLFLETLMAAREVLYLSHVGVSETDGTVRPPSPVLAEVLDQVQATVAFSGAGSDAASDARALRARFITTHPLQPFSPRYFSGAEKLFSFSPRFAAASRLAGPHMPAAHAAFAAALPAAPAELLAVTPARFEKFLAHPPRFFLRERLGVDIPYALDVLQDAEPVELTDARALRRRLYEQPEHGLGSLRAEGLLPGGSWGERLWREQADSVEAMRERVAALQAEPMAPLSVDLTIDGVTFRGPLNEMTRTGILRVSLENRIYPTDVLRLRFAHLLLCASAPADVVHESRLVGLEQTLVLPPVANPLAALRTFAAAYHEGLCLPLPLFRRASPAYVKKQQSLDEARKAYEGNEYSGGSDAADAWTALLWRDTDPCDARFAEWADRLYGPLLDALKDI
ncbi:MAG: exodeoxyribonuclease V subunit gamma [Moraxellaceae bacterium]|nr:exodeoxyribonuclease V subunit gamma [Moraxellaceae bacterium]